MPKSKRNQKVSLTKTKKKGLARKESLIDEVKQCIEKYSNLFLFSHENIRTKFMQDIREQFRENSRFFFGKNRVMALALGLTKDTEAAENLHLMSQKLRGDRALMFTNLSKEEVVKHFDELSIPEFAKGGCTAISSFSIPEGPLEMFSHTLEPHLRKMGLPVQMKKGVIFMYCPYDVCKEGQILDSTKAKILKLFGEKMANFKIVMEYAWTKEGTFEDLGRDDEDIVSKKKKKIKKTGKRRAKKTQTVVVDSTGEELENGDDEEMEQDEGE